MKKIMVISLIAVLSLTSIGCNKDNFKQALVETPLGMYSHDFNEVSGFFDVYEAWKYDVDNLSSILCVHVAGNSNAHNTRNTMLDDGVLI